jgi:hypothetical protein
MAEAEPSRLMPRKVCGCAAALMALMAVGAVLEAERHGKARGHLPVRLRLRGARTDGRPADEVGDVLRRDGVEQLRRGGQAEIEHIAQERAGEAQAGADVVRAVEMRIHDQALPADRGAGLFEIHAHHDHHAVADLAGQCGQSAGVVAAGLEVVNRARPDNQEEASVVGEDELVDFTPGPGDELGLGLGFRQLTQQCSGRRQGAGLDDIDVGSSLHEGSACGGRWHWIKSAVCAMNLGKEKAGRLPLSDRPLLS